MDITPILQKCPPFAGSKGLVFIDDSYVLVFERDGGTDFYPNHDDLPGGRSEANETPFETFRRELYEEFGVHVVPEEVTYYSTAPDVNIHSKGLDVYFIVANLHQEHRKQIRFGKDEGRGYKAIHLDKVLTDTNFIPQYQEFIKEYLQYAEDHRKPLRNQRGHIADHLVLA